MTREKAVTLRSLMEQAAVSLGDADAVKAVELFPVWKPETDYTQGQRIRWAGSLYRLIPAEHHSQQDWTPNLTPSIWARIDDPAEEWPEWRQPLGSEDAYPAGAKVRHGGQHWVNIFGDSNIWEPGVYGWALSK